MRFSWIQSSERRGEHKETVASESTPLVGLTKEEKRWRFLPWRSDPVANLNANHIRIRGISQLSSGTDFGSVVDRFSQSEINDLVEVFATKDKDEDKTWSRLLVERYFEKQSWYFPRRPGGPSLSKAWAFYEHMTLPRYVWKAADHVFRLADPGESQPTKLYNPTTMPQSCFVEFSLGLDQYFSSLMMLSIMFLVCFFMNIPTMLYYSSPYYSGEGGKSHLPWGLRASAICTQKIWVVCEDCTPEQWGWEEQKTTFGTASDGTVLVKRNDCGESRILNGLIDLATFVFVAVYIIVLCYYLHARETRFGEDRLTADDFSLTVDNPPPDAKNPDEWRDFFNQFADKQVTMVTVALDNEAMLKKLVERRLHTYKLRNLLPDHIDLDDDAMVRAALSRLMAEHDEVSINWVGKLFEGLLRASGVLISAQQSMQRRRQLTDEILELQKRKYNVSSVFITFETEEGQRRALSSFKKTPKQIPTFQGKVLIVKRAAEPTSINWLHLSASQSKTATVMAINLAITFFAVGIAAYSETVVRRAAGPVYASPLVSVFNSAIPYLVEVLMSLEHHRTEDTWQASYFSKITLFRWVNTAIAIKVFTPFTSNLDDDSKDVLPSMYYILISELFVTPCIKVADFAGTFQRHFSAPRAVTQKEMNLNFLGTPYRLGERFTAMTNILFVCFFYSSVLPVTFFFGFAIFLVQYYTDKYCIVRVWKRAPALGPNLARISRRYFFSTALVVFICSSAFAVAQFPYDNVCDKVGDVERVTHKEFNDVRLLDGSLVNVTVSQEHPSYYCSQGLEDMGTTFPFPPLPHIQPDGYHWMTKEQEELCQVFGWASVAVVIAFLAYFMKEIRAHVVSFFSRTSEPGDSKSQHIDFSCIQRIVSYIPMIPHVSLSYPLLACNVDGIDEALIGWRDENQSYDKCNLIFDVPFPGLHRSKEVSSGCLAKLQKSLQGSREVLGDTAKSAWENEPIFSFVKHYPTPWQKKIQLEREMVGGSFDASGQTYVSLC